MKGRGDAVAAAEAHEYAHMNTGMHVQGPRGVLLAREHHLVVDQVVGRVAQTKKGAVQSWG